MDEIQDLLSIEHFLWSSAGSCILYGSLIGLERQVKGKPVGILTASLIVLGTYIFLTISQHFFPNSSDPTRIIGQIVTGIGFLGVGVMLAKDSVILGVTLAATIWVLASIGVIIPVAGNGTVIKMSLVVLAILFSVNRLERIFSSLTRGVHADYSVWRQREDRPSWWRRRYVYPGASNRVVECDPRWQHDSKIARFFCRAFL